MPLGASVTRGRENAGCHQSGLYIELNIEDFITYKYRNKMIIDSIHCPSVELNLIWNEKIFLIINHMVNELVLPTLYMLTDNNKKRFWKKSVLANRTYSPCVSS